MADHPPVDMSPEAVSARFAEMGRLSVPMTLEEARAVLAEGEPVPRVDPDELNGLHDATLRDVHVAWATRVVTLTFVTAHGARVLRVTECTDLHVPMGEPWGRSVSVMSVTPLEGEVGLEVEMQSGDRLVVRGVIASREPAETGARPAASVRTYQCLGFV